MRRLLVVCALLLVSACGDEGEDQRPTTPPTLTVTVKEKVCDPEAQGMLFEGRYFFRLDARIESSTVLRDFGCSGKNTMGASVKCGGPPERLDGSWEGLLECRFEDWNRDEDSALECSGVSVEDGQEAYLNLRDSLVGLPDCR